MQLRFCDNDLNNFRTMPFSAGMVLKNSEIASLGFDAV